MGVGKSRAPANPGWRILRPLLLLSALSPSGLGAQGAVVSGLLTMELSLAEAPLPVSLTYRLRPDSLAREVELTLLTPGRTRLADPEFELGDDRRPLHLREIRPHYWTAMVPLPSPGQREVSLGITYGVRGAWEDGGAATVPVLAVAWVPADPGPRTFVAQVRVPEGRTVVESFPTSVTQRPPGGEEGVYEMALQGIPAMLVLRTTRGEAPILTLERVLDGLVVAVLLVMGLAGFRVLREGGG